MEKQGKIVEMKTSTNAEGLVEINDEPQVEIEVEQEEQQPEMSDAAKEWMDRANRLYEQNLQMKKQLEYLQSNQDMQFITAMTALYKVDDARLKALAKAHLINMLSSQSETSTDKQ